MADEKNVLISDQELDAIIQAVHNGVKIGDICNVSQETIEGLYALAYNLYTTQSYKDAETVFQALCLYDHKDIRFWMGLAGCRQAREDFQGAIDAYGMAGFASVLGDPTPFLYAARCHLQLGDKENALGALRI